MVSSSSSPIAAISHVFPDFITSVTVPQVITGEHFDGEGLELWCWAPKNSATELRQSAASLGETPPALPAQPPADAMRIEPIDVERQVMVARLTGDVLWVRTGAGWSAPYLLNVARPFWLSQAEARPGELLHLYGFGLRREESGPHRPVPDALREGTVLLKGMGETLFAEPIYEGRSTQWIADSRLIYFRVPAEAPAGHYQVYIHNGHGGEFGWSPAGSLEVHSEIPAAKPEVNVRAFGAQGDGFSDDLPAIMAAIQAVEATGGSVLLPPGTYRIEETLCLPPGVKLLGAGRENTLIKGVGFDPAAGPPAAVLALTDHTGIKALTICGSVSRGVPSVIMPRSEMSTDAMIRLLPSRRGEAVEDVSIIDCRLRALEEAPDTREPLYLKAIHVGHDYLGRCKHVTIHNNEIYGSLIFWRGERMEIVRNTWLDSTATINVAIHGWATDSLLDSNIFRDTPGRLCFYPLRHCYLRFNEIHGAFRGSWTNAEEVYLIHGDFEDYFGEHYQRATGTATGGSTTTLSDATRQWQPDSHVDSVVIITAGTGFGQYRHVSGNTADTLVIDRPWRVAPDASSEYVVGRMYAENALYANLNDTPLRMSLWMDCIANVIESHRDEYAKGLDIWGCDYSSRDDNGVPQRANEFHPSWYNMVLNGWMDGAMAHLHCNVQAANLHQGPPMFANILAYNKVRQPHMARTGFSHNTIAVGGMLVGNYPYRKQNLPTRSGLSHTILANNEFSFTNCGINIRKSARKTFVLDTLFQHVEIPIIDDGARTILHCNRMLTVNEQGIQRTEIPDMESTREIADTPEAQMVDLRQNGVIM